MVKATFKTRVEYKDEKLQVKKVISYRQEPSFYWAVHMPNC